MAHTEPSKRQTALVLEPITTARGKCYGLRMVQRRLGSRQWRVAISLGSKKRNEEETGERMYANGMRVSSADARGHMRLMGARQAGQQIAWCSSSFWGEVNKALYIGSSVSMFYAQEKLQSKATSRTYQRSLSISSSFAHVRGCEYLATLTAQSAEIIPVSHSVPQGALLVTICSSQST